MRIAGVIECPDFPPNSSNESYHRAVRYDVLQVGESSLYTALQRLLLNGWARAEWGASENNRRARYYTITAAAKKRLAAEREEFDRLVLAIQQVLAT